MRSDWSQRLAVAVGTLGLMTVLIVWLAALTLIYVFAWGNNVPFSDPHLLAPTIIAALGMLATLRALLLGVRVLSDTRTPMTFAMATAPVVVLAVVWVAEIALTHTVVID